MSDRTIDLAKWLCERLSASQNIAMEDRGYCDDCLEDAQKFLAAPSPTTKEPDDNGPYLDIFEALKQQANEAPKPSLRESIEPPKPKGETAMKLDPEVWNAAMPTPPAPALSTTALVADLKRLFHSLELTDADADRLAAEAISRHVKAAVIYLGG